MVPNPSQPGSREAAAPAWLADSEAAKPARPADRMAAAMAAVHLGKFPRRAVLQRLAFHDGPGGAFPSMDSIAESLGMHRATVHRHLTALGKAGAVWWRQSRGPSHYRLNWPLILSETVAKCDSLDGEETVAIPAGNRRNFDDKPSQSFATQTGSNRNSEPEGDSKPSGAAPATPRQEVLPPLADEPARPRRKLTQREITAQGLQALRATIPGLDDD